MWAVRSLAHVERPPSCAPCCTPCCVEDADWAACEGLRLGLMGLAGVVKVVKAESQLGSGKQFPPGCQSLYLGLWAGQHEAIVLQDLQVGQTRGRACV